MEFNNLHQQNTPLLIANVWDVPSARAAQQAGYQAIGTSSSAMANMLGYEDGEEMSFAELLYLVKRITANSNLPLSVDLEAGYSRDPYLVVQHIQQLHSLGVQGLNFEDSLVDKKRAILPAEIVAQTIKTIKSQLVEKKISMFLNIRTDVFLLGLENPVEETKRRIALYVAAGADGLFVPCIEQPKDIEKIVQSTTLPINVMCMPGLPNFEELTALGVRRISMGNFIFNNLYQHFGDTLQKIKRERSFQTIFNQC